MDIIKINKNFDGEMNFFNPLTSRLYYMISFSFIKAFIINYKINIERRRFNAEEIEDILKLNENKKFTDNVRFITNDMYPDEW